MKDSGKITYIMALENFIMQVEIFMKVNFMREKPMGLVSISKKTVLYLKLSGLIAYPTDMEK